MAGMGLGWSTANSEMAGQLRQRIADQIAAQQRERDAAQQKFVNDRLTANDARQAEEHAANMADRRAGILRGIQGERDTAAGKALPGLGIGTAVDPSTFAQTYKGTSSESDFTPERTLPSTQTAGAMPLDPTQASSQVTTDAPRQITGRMISMGTDKQRTGEEQKAGQLRLMADPSLTPRERLMIGMENAGLKVPAGMEPKPPSHLVPVDKGGKGVYINEADAAGQPVFEKPQHDPSPSYQLQPEIDPATGAQTGKFKGYNTKANRFEPVAGDTPASTKAAPGAAQDAAWNSKRSDAVAKLGIVDQSIDAAKDLIGPGMGRIATLEQMIGSPDPRISDLKTKLLTVKDQVVGALTRSNRQPSPAMMKRFDELLGTQLTPESLHAATNALRQMLSPSDGVTTPSAKADPLGIR